MLLDIIIPNLDLKPDQAYLDEGAAFTDKLAAALRRVTTAHGATGSYEWQKDCLDAIADLVKGTQGMIAASLAAAIVSVDEHRLEDGWALISALKGDSRFIANGYDRCGYPVLALREDVEPSWTDEQNNAFMSAFHKKIDEAFPDQEEMEADELISVLWHFLDERYPDGVPLSLYLFLLNPMFDSKMETLQVLTLHLRYGVMVLDYGYNGDKDFRLKTGKYQTGEELSARLKQEMQGAFAA